MSTLTKKRPGLLVVTKDGRKGRTFHDEGLVNNKVPVHIIDSDFSPTGEKVLIRKDRLQVRGHYD